MVILGAAGGVGGYLVQLASHAGFEVIATSRSVDKARLLSYGAAEVVVYDDEDVRSAITQLYPEGADIVVDLVHQAEQIIPTNTCVRNGGHLLSTLFGPPQESFPKKLTVTYLQVNPQSGDLESLVDAAARAALQIMVSATYPFSDTKSALLALRDGRVRGKIVIEATE